eukprot:scaffold48_cov311-Pinguiococcus_pyrenoidosus.AAC.320
MASSSRYSWRRGRSLYFNLRLPEEGSCLRNPFANLRCRASFPLIGRLHPSRFPPRVPDDPICPLQAHLPLKHGEIMRKMMHVFGA